MLAAVSVCELGFAIPIIIRLFANAYPALTVVQFSWEKNQKLDQKKQKSPLY